MASIQALRTRSQAKRQQPPQQDTTPFFIPDSSPLFQYGDGIKSTWTPGYALQADGFDQTLHLTSSRERISFNISATSMTLLIPSFTNCTATISINASTPIKACATTTTTGDIPFSVFNLPLGLHNVQWESGPVGENDQLIFWGIDGDRKSDVQGSTNVTIDDTYSRDPSVSFRYEGAWDHFDGKNKGTEVNLDQNFNSSLAVTSKTGASVSFTGTGSAVYLYGTVGPDHGTASIILNGNTVSDRMNLTSPWSMGYQLLWFATGLDFSRPLEVKMTNLEEKKMAIDFVVLTADPKTLSSLNTSGSDEDFLSSIAGKLVIYLFIPLVVLSLFGISLYCFVRRRKRPTRKTKTQTPSVYLDGHDKRESAAGWSTYSGHSQRSTEEVFVSYTDGIGQRLSERWNSPSLARSPYTTPNAPSLTMAALPEGQSTAGSPTEQNGTAGTWSRPLRSLLGSSLTGSSISTGHKRRTDLPPYSPGANGTFASVGSEQHVSAESEKAAKLRLAAGISISEPNLPIQGPSSHRESTIAPSEVLSVFGQPGSEKRDSAMTTFSHFTQPRNSSSQGLPTRPTVNTDVRFSQSPLSSLSSAQVNSAAPLLHFSPQTMWREDGVRRNRSTTGLSVVSSEGSAARPDSDIIPFESFMGVLQWGERGSRQV